MPAPDTPSLSHLPLNALRVLDAVARRGGFRAAADDLCVTQSAVSHQIRLLEEWLGRPLFDRTGPRPRLLPHGADLARTLALSLSEIDAACRRARAAPHPRALVIAAIPSVAVCWLIPRLHAFRAAHPDIALRLVYALHGQEIAFRDVDLAFVFARDGEAPPGPVAEAFLPGASVPVCSPALATSPIPPARFVATGLLHDTDEGDWATWFGRAGLPPPPAGSGPVFEDFNLLRAAALSGQGIALCPLAMIGPDLAAGRLVQLSRIEVLENAGYFLLRPAGEETAAAAAFRDWACAMRDG